eukprot:CAMPEP_0116834624 /NCGR_PEP_ID=MMETSP0418-20121206/7092_1 /TAXON_ID=1158023 /ORGANISM="Astrosyne radiata, Strain 13vi08-1A" /LENGTH=204 /DNA_ID=CAMNT_0004464199 /DNA_START=52 /DNA_END=666 /DNA_ORIENTATION=+
MAIKRYCVDGGFGDRLWCMLDYEGNQLDVLINYPLLVVNFLVCVLALCLQPTTDAAKVRKLRWYAFACLVCVTLFQLGLCSLVYCTGISIVWCAMGGWIIRERRQLQESTERSSLRTDSLALERIVIVLDFCIILYYAFVANPITTVAHVCAVVLGAILSLLSVPLVEGGEAEEGESGAPTAILVEEAHAPSTEPLIVADEAKA